MAHSFQISSNIQTSQPLPDGLRVRLTFSPDHLVRSGFNIPVLISSPSLPNSQNQAPTDDIKSVLVAAHFDTGASITSIDKKLAEYLKLVPVGAGISHTAGGPTETTNYVIDLSFPGSKLSPFPNLRISSCDLSYQFDGDSPGKAVPQNFGLLLGRDVMARWNIVWNGPTSTVFISD